MFLYIHIDRQSVLLCAHLYFIYSLVWLSVCLFSQPVYVAVLGKLGLFDFEAGNGGKA